MDKIADELDVINYIGLYRSVEFLKKIILSKPIRKLIHYSKYNVIEDSEIVKIKIRDEEKEKEAS